MHLWSFWPLHWPFTSWHRRLCALVTILGMDAPLPSVRSLWVTGPHHWMLPKGSMLMCRQTRRFQVGLLPSPIQLSGWRPLTGDPHFVTAANRCRFLVVGSVWIAVQWISTMCTKQGVLRLTLEPGFTCPMLHRLKHHLPLAQQGDGDDVGWIQAQVMDNHCWRWASRMVLTQDPCFDPSFHGQPRPRHAQSDAEWWDVLRMMVRDTFTALEIFKALMVQAQEFWVAGARFWKLARAPLPP